MKCGECGATITPEYHKKFYKRTNRLAEYYMYRCTKKLGPCSQRYLSQAEVGNQLRKLVLDVAIPVAWIPRWLKLLDEHEVIEKQNQEANIQRLEEDEKVVEQKLNLLLDSYLDGVIDQESYKSKKNELFERKLKTQEKISQVRLNGSSWLEPFREFMNVAKNGAKIARAKNNCEELASFAKNIGSNFFLTNRHLSADYKLGFNTLFSELSRSTRTRARLPDFLCERDTRIELASHPWEGRILPLYESRISSF